MTSARPLLSASTVEKRSNTRTGSSEDRTVTPLPRRMRSVTVAMPASTVSGEEIAKSGRWCSPTVNTSTPLASAIFASSTVTRIASASETSRPSSSRGMSPKVSRPSSMGVVMGLSLLSWTVLLVEPSTRRECSRGLSSAREHPRRSGSFRGEAGSGRDLQLHGVLLEPGGHDRGEACGGLGGGRHRDGALALLELDRAELEARTVLRREPQPRGLEVFTVAAVSGPCRPDGDGDLLAGCGRLRRDLDDRGLARALALDGDRRRRCSLLRRSRDRCASSESRREGGHEQRGHAGPHECSCPSRAKCSGVGSTTWAAYSGCRGSHAR